MMGMAPFMSGSYQTKGGSLAVGNVYAFPNLYKRCPVSVQGLLIKRGADRLLPLRC